MTDPIENINPNALKSAVTGEPFKKQEPVVDQPAITKQQVVKSTSVSGINTDALNNAVQNKVPVPDKKKDGGTPSDGGVGNVGLNTASQSPSGGIGLNNADVTHLGNLASSVDGNVDQPKQELPKEIPPSTKPEKQTVDSKTFLEQDLQKSHISLREDLSFVPRTSPFYNKVNPNTKTFYTPQEVGHIETQFKVDEIKNNPVNLVAYKNKRVKEIQQQIDEKKDEYSKVLPNNKMLDNISEETIKKANDIQQQVNDLSSYSNDLQKSVQDNAFDFQTAKDHLSTFLSAHQVKIKPRTDAGVELTLGTNAIDENKPFSPTDNLDNYDLSSINEALTRGGSSAFRSQYNVSEADMIAFNKYQQKRNLQDVLKGNPDINDAAVLYMASQDKTLQNTLNTFGAKDVTSPSKMIDEISAAQAVESFVNNQDIQELAKTDNSLALKINRAKNSIYQNFPKYAYAQISGVLAQERENRNMNSPFYNDPSVASTDRLVDKLVEQGYGVDANGNKIEFNANTKAAYNQTIRPYLDKGFFSQLWNGQTIKTTGGIESIGRGLSQGGEMVGNTMRFVVNNVTPAQQLGLIASDAELKKDYVTQEGYDAYAQVNGRNAISKIRSGGLEFAGSLLPFMMTDGIGEITNAGKVGRAVMNASLFAGENYKHAVTTYDDPLKQAISFATNSFVDGTLAEFLPSHKINSTVKQIFARRVDNVLKDVVIDNLKPETITEVKNKLGNILNDVILKPIGKTLSETTKTALVVSAFGGFHNLNGVLLGDPRNTGLDGVATNFYHDFKTNFLNSLILGTAAGVKETASGMRLNIHNAPDAVKGRFVSEMAKNAPYYKSYIEQKALVSPETAAIKNDLIKNLNTAEIIHNGLQTEDIANKMTPEQQRKYLLFGVRQKIYENKAENAVDDVIKEDYKNKAAEAKKVKENIWNGQDQATDQVEQMPVDESLKTKVDAAPTEAEKVAIEDQHINDLVNEHTATTAPIDNNVGAEKKTTPVETKPVDQQPAETPPVETPPVETKPVETTQPTETKPVEKPTEVKQAQPKTERVVQKVTSANEISQGDVVDWRGQDAKVEAKNGSKFDLRIISKAGQPMHTVKGAEISDAEFGGKVSSGTPQASGGKTGTSEPATNATITTDEQARASLTPEEKKQYLDHVTNLKLDEAQKILDSKKTAQKNPPASTEIRAQNLNELDSKINNTDNAEQKTVLQNIKKVASTVTQSVPDSKVILHDTNDSFMQAYHDAGGTGTARGFFNNGKEIHINLQYANNETAFHEGAHQIFKHLFNNSPEFTDKFYNQLQKVLPDFHKTNLHRFVERGYPEADNQTKRDEFVTEFFARVASGKINLDKVEQSTFDKIKELIRKTAERIGFNPKYIGLDSKKDVVAFAKRLTDAFKEGKKLSKISIAKNDLLDNRPALRAQAIEGDAKPKEYKIGITNAAEKDVDEQIGTRLDHARLLEQAGRHDEANAIYKDVIRPAEQRVKDVFRDLKEISVEVNPTKGNFFNTTEPTLETTIRDEDSHTNEIISRMADLGEQWKQWGVHISEMLHDLPEGEQFGKTLPDKSVYEPNLEIRFDKALSEEDIKKMNETIQSTGLAGSTLHSDNQGLTLYNISTFKPHEQFINETGELLTILHEGGIRFEVERNAQKLWNIANENGSITYDQAKSLRDENASDTTTAATAISDQRQSDSSGQQQPTSLTTRQGVELPVRASAINKFDEAKLRVKELADAGHISPEDAQAAYDKIDKQEKSTPPPTEDNSQKTSSSEKRTSSVKNAEVNAKREEFGLDQIENTITRSDASVVKEATKAIRKGYDVNELIDRVLQDKDQMNDVETEILGRYISGKEGRVHDLNSQIEETIKNGGDASKLFIQRDREINDMNVADLAAKRSGTEQARAFRQRQKVRQENKTLADKFGEYTENAGRTKLTPKEVKDITDAYNKEKTARGKYQKKVRNLQAQVRRVKAKENVDNVKKVATKSTAKDYKKERTSIKQSIFDKLSKFRSGDLKTGENNSTRSMAMEGGDQSTIPSGENKDVNQNRRPVEDELRAIAPDLNKYVRNLIDDNKSMSFDNVVNDVHDLLKEQMPDVTKDHVIEFLSGEYNPKRASKSEVAAKMEDLRIQAKLIKKLEDLQNGTEPKEEQAKRTRNREIEKLQGQISDFRRNVREAEKAQKSGGVSQPNRTPEQIALDNIKKRTATEINRVREKIAKGDFAPDEKNKSKPLDQEAKNLKNELIKARIEWQELANKAAIERKGWFKDSEGRGGLHGVLQGKTADVLTEIMNAPRTLMASMDFSAPLRQGIVASAGHPIIASKAFAEMLKQSISEKRYNAWLDDLYQSDHYQTMKDSGLYIADKNSHKLNNREESFMNNLVERIPIIGTWLVKGSERAYTSYLNKLRVDVFMDAADTFMKSGKTPENHPELYKAWASFVNSSTGRGSLGKFEESGQILNTVFFSPRLIASRIGLMTDFVTLGGYKSTPTEIRVRKMKDLLAFIAVGSSMLALAGFAAKAVFNGDDKNKVSVESNPHSSDFGKLRIGNTRIDVWGGFQQYVRFTAQMLPSMLGGGYVKTTTGKTYSLDKKEFPFKKRSDVIWSFVKGKFAPVPSLAVSGFKNPMTGDSQSAGQLLYNNMLPLSLQDVNDAGQDGGIARAFFALPTIFGVGVNTYQPTKK